MSVHRGVGHIDPEVLGARLREQSQIDDPSTGAAEPLEVEARSKLWPHPSNWAVIEQVEVADSGARRLEEYRFVPEPEAQVLPAFQGAGLPVAILFERSPNGLSRARVYSAAALAERHTPTLPVDIRLKLTRADDVLTRYFAALQSGDVAAALATFEQQGYVQCPDGERYQGRERLRLLFTRWLQRGAIAVRHCARFDDGPRTVLESLLPDGDSVLYVCDRGRTRGLAAARTYR